MRGKELYFFRAIIYARSTLKLTLYILKMKKQLPVKYIKDRRLKFRKIEAR